MISNKTIQQTTRDMADYAASMSSHVSDEDNVMAMFSAQNSFLLLGVIKKESNLVNQFEKAFSKRDEGDDDDHYDSDSCDHDEHSIATTVTPDTQQT
jgi:hypothetical protein